MTDGVATGLGIFEGHVMKEADKDVLGAGERWGGVIGIFFIIFFVWLFLNAQGRGYIFTSEFSSMDAVLFYGSALYGIVPIVIRLMTGRRNLGRLFDIMGSLIFLAVGSYFLVKFPFDFSNFYEVFPQSIQFLFQWISDPIVKGFLVFALVVTALVVVYQALMFLLVRSELKRRSSRRKEGAL